MHTRQCLVTQAEGEMVRFSTRGRTFRCIQTNSHFTRGHSASASFSRAWGIQILPCSRSGLPSSSRSIHSVLFGSKQTLQRRFRIFFVGDGRVAYFALSPSSVHGVSRPVLARACGPPPSPGAADRLSESSQPLAFDCHAPLQVSSFFHLLLRQQSEGCVREYPT